MEKLLEKIGLYDFFARLVMGLTIVILAEIFGIINCLHLFSEDKSAFTVPAILLGGYFIGIVLEELAYWAEHIVEAKKQKSSPPPKDISAEQLEKMKRRIIGTGHEGLIEAPLTHVVMSQGYAIALAMITVVNIIRAISSNGPLTENGWIWKYIIAPAALTIVFTLRQYRYKARRIELIERYYDAYCNKENVKSDNQTEE